MNVISTFFLGTGLFTTRKESIIHFWRVQSTSQYQEAASHSFFKLPIQLGLQPVMLRLQISFCVGL